MKANSPEVIYLIDTGDGVAWCGDPDPAGYGECDDAVKYVRGDAYEALQSECAALVEALDGAARSLETISKLAGRDEYMQEMIEVRGYASSRAAVARSALSAHREQQGGDV